MWTIIKVIIKQCELLFQILNFQGIRKYENMQKLFDKNLLDQLFVQIKQRLTRGALSNQISFV